MGIESLHPEYVDRIDDWTICRDVYEGQRAVKEAGERYLPKLKSQEPEDYRAYKKRALFYSITSKTISALTGMAMSKPIISEHPEELNYLFVDNSGLEFYEFVVKTLNEVLLMGRFGVLLDRAYENAPPSLVTYPTESIVNWRLSKKGELEMVVLREIIWTQGDDEFEQKSECIYRVLKILDGVYYQELWREKEKDPYDIIVPTNRGKMMDFIPFMVMNPVGISWEIVKPPMLDIANINISHYQTSADLEQGRHFTGLPTPVVSGVDSSTVLTIGSEKAWILPDQHAKATFLEFTGQGLLSLEKALAEKQTQLASLSARLLDNSGNGSEAAETVRLRYMSETASLSAVVRACEAFVTKAIKVIAMMEELDSTKVAIKMDKDFLNSKLSPQEITALTTAFVEGAISEETLVYNLRRGDQLAPSTTDSQEIAKLRERRQEVADAQAKAAKAKSGPTNPKQE